jgi:hypothetical protein
VLDNWFSHIYGASHGIFVQQNLPTATVSKSQLLLARKLARILPYLEEDSIRMNYSPPYISYKNFRPIELDIFVPCKGLALEYQGEQHYSFHYKVGNPKLQKLRDKQKEMICQKEGITLLQIPYWWDTTEYSLKNILISVRPDLFPTAYKREATREFSRFASLLSSPKRRKHRSYSTLVNVIKLDDDADNECQVQIFNSNCLNMLDDINVQVEYCMWLAKSLDIVEPERWFEISSGSI